LTWEKLWAVGRYDLRLSEEEFWHMVPRQYSALLKRHHQEFIRHEFGPAIICSAIFSTHGVRADYEKFMPSLKKPPKKEATWEDHLAKVKALHVALGGKL